MSKKVLILAIGCSLDPWAKMAVTSKQTWDSVEVDGVETIFYFGQPVKQNTDKEIYFDVKEAYSTMGYKLLLALDWALKNKEFDYIARVNGSCYVDKKELIKHVQTLQDAHLFAGAIVPKGEQYQYPWIWGGGQLLISKNIVERIIENKNKFNHKLIEDVALSKLIHDLHIPLTSGNSVSIDRNGDKWRSIGYGYNSYEFASFDELRKEGVFFYRCKQDLQRDQDEFIMRELFRVLN